MKGSIIGGAVKSWKNLDIMLFFKIFIIEHVKGPVFCRVRLIPFKRSSCRESTDSTRLDVISFWHELTLKLK